MLRLAAILALLSASPVMASDLDTFLKHLFNAPGVHVPLVDAAPTVYTPEPDPFPSDGEPVPEDDPHPEAAPPPIP